MKNKGEKSNNKSEKSKDKKDIISKENENGLLFYVGIIILIMIVFSVSYYAGSFFRNKSDIPIGQEYRLKNITSGTNSTFKVVYYDNDARHTERVILPTNYNKFNIIESNSTVAILKLERSENGVNYWNIYMQRKNSQAIHIK